MLIAPFVIVMLDVIMLSVIVPNVMAPSKLVMTGTAFNKLTCSVFIQVDICVLAFSGLSTVCPITNFMGNSCLASH
jgi:hypothetical protein